MNPVDSASSSSGLPQLFQTAATAKALDVQKQEGQAALQLIQSATDVAQTALSSGPKATGNNVDVTV
ncbi:MAG: hypothetical protein ACE5E9_01370 [Nitrospinaceae bacterium]